MTRVPIGPAQRYRRWAYQHASSVLAHDAVDDGQTQASSTGFGGEEGVEDGHFVGESRAVVFHFDAEGAFGIGGERAELDLSASPAPLQGFQGVCQEVFQSLLQVSALHFD